MKIGDVEVGGSAPCRFVAEISNAHNGSLTRALKLIDAAKEAGADFAKLQCYEPAELVTLRGDGPAPKPWDHMTMDRLYAKAQTPHKWFPKLFAHARDIGIVPFASVFGLRSLEVLRAVDCPAIKISKLDRGVRWLVGAAFVLDKPVLVSTSGTGWTVFSGVLWPASTDPRNHETKEYRVQFLYCPGEYPCAVKDIHLPKFGGNDAGPYIGLSSHCLALELPIAAVARGAKLLEYHFMLEREPSELESNVSLTEKQFAEMVQQRPTD
jgi:sialic acid synthase SpsE